MNKKLDYRVHLNNKTVINKCGEKSDTIKDIIVYLSILAVLLGICIFIKELIL